MAFNVERNIGPGGLMGMPAPEIGEVEVDVMSDEDPEIEIVINKDGTVTVEMGDEDDGACEFGDNLVEHLDDSVLDKLCDDLIEDFEADVTSRSDWIKAYLNGLEYLGLKYEERTEPWPNACGAYHPMLAEAVVRFQSEAMSETFPAAGPVKTQIKGKETPEKLEASHRVAEDMNHKLTDEMCEYRQEHERLLWALPLAGSAFKKVYYDELLGRQTGVFVPAEDLIIPFGASNIETAERVTHIMRRTHNELKKLMHSGFYTEYDDIDEPTGDLDATQKEKAETTEEGYSIVTDNRHKVLEIQVELDLEGFEDEDEDGKETGIALPYVVTILPNESKILSIRRNYEEDDKKKLKLQHFVQYTYVPGTGVYGYGLIHLIGGFIRSATSVMRQLVDAGTLSNLPGGLKARGMRIVKGDDTPIGPGEWRDVDIASGSIRDNIYPLPYKEPSPTLYQLLGDFVSEGKSFINASDLNVSDMSAQAPVGTTLAILERQLKVMGAIQARLHYSMRQEFKLLKIIIRDCMPDEYSYDVEGGSRSVKKADYDLCEVTPVSDPNASTMAQKIVQYQTVMQMAQQTPGIYDQAVLHRQMLDILGIKNAEKLVPIDDDLRNTDPVTENQKLITGKPVKAFLAQDHESHIMSHMAFMQDPKIQAIAQNDPTIQAKMAAMYAHIAEHIAFEYRKKIEEQMGVSLPVVEDDEEMPVEMEVAVSRMAAEAGQMLLQKNQKEAAAQQAQEQAQDPIVQMQQQELQIKQQDAQTKAQDAQAKAQAKAKEVELKEKQIMAEAADKADQTRLKEQELALKTQQIMMDAAHKADQIQTKEAEIESREKMAEAEMALTLQTNMGEREHAEELEGAKLLAEHSNKQLDRDERMRSAKLMAARNRATDKKPKGKDDKK